MASAQSMLCPGRLARLAAMIVLIAPAAGCDLLPRRELAEPALTVSPYATSEGDRLWAVLPMRNESGTSLVDPIEMGDALVAAVEEVEGLRALAMNRTLAAMRQAEIETVSSPAEAQRLANLLGVDGLVVGTVTAYDPYSPPKLGMSLALFSRDGSRSDSGLDPQRLAAQPRPTEVPGSSYRDPPTATYSAHLDAQSHAVLERVRLYAVGRHDPENALGWKRHLASMDLYTRFAAYEAVAGLLEEERLRLAPEPVDDPP